MCVCFVRSFVRLFVCLLAYIYMHVHICVLCVYICVIWTAHANLHVYVYEMLMYVCVGLHTCMHARIHSSMHATNNHICLCMQHMYAMMIIRNFSRNPGSAKKLKSRVQISYSMDFLSMAWGVYL